MRMELIQIIIKTVLLINYLVTVLSSPNFTSPPANGAQNDTKLPPLLTSNDNDNKRSYNVPGYGAVLTCRDCKYIHTFGGIKIEDKWDKKVATCPSSECDRDKGENVCIKVGYNIKNTYIERYKCGNTTILDSECPYTSCPVFQDVCLKVFYPNNTITDCLYESTLSRKTYSPCIPILKYYTFATNCTVGPAEESCVCGSLGVQISLTVLLTSLYVLVT